MSLDNWRVRRRCACWLSAARCRHRAHSFRSARSLSLAHSPHSPAAMRCRRRSRASSYRRSRSGGCAARWRAVASASRRRQRPQLTRSGRPRLPPQLSTAPPHGIAHGLEVFRPAGGAARDCGRGSAGGCRRHGPSRADTATTAARAPAGRRTWNTSGRAAPDQWLLAWLHLPPARYDRRHFRHRVCRPAGRLQVTHRPAAMRRARSAADRSCAAWAHCWHVLRSGRGGCFPHRVQRPSAARSW